MQYIEQPNHWQDHDKLLLRNESIKKRRFNPIVPVNEVNKASRTKITYLFLKRSKIIISILFCTSSPSYGTIRIPAGLAIIELLL